MSLPTLLLAAALVAAPSDESAEHVFVFIRTGTREVVGEAAQEAMAGHFANMSRLAGEGRLSLAGPFGPPKFDEDDRGLWIFSGGDVDAVAPHAASDPCVVDEVFALELVPFATDWPIDAIGALTELERLRGSVDQGGISPYVLATRRGPEPDLADAVAAGDVVLVGAFGGERAGTWLVVWAAEDPDAARAAIDRHELEADTWDLRPWWATGLLKRMGELRARERAAGVRLEPAALDAPVEPSGSLSRAADVFGVRVLATDAVPDAKVVHAATVLAELLDADEDGRPDDRRTTLALAEAGAALVLRTAEDRPLVAADLRPAGILHAEVLDAATVSAEAWPYLPSAGTFDESVMAAARLLAFGVRLAYPGVFGTGEDTPLTVARRAAEEGWFDPRPAADLDERTRSYFAWALTSRLGLQAQPRRQEELAATWRLPTPALLREGDPAVWDLLGEPRFRLPRVGPDGRYR